MLCWSNFDLFNNRCAWVCFCIVYRDELSRFSTSAFFHCFSHIEYVLVIIIMRCPTDPATVYLGVTYPTFTVPLFTLFTLYAIQDSKRNIHPHCYSIFLPFL